MELMEEQQEEKFLNEDTTKGTQRRKIKTPIRRQGRDSDL